MLIQRKAFRDIQTALRRQAAVALLGPRQVGKTTLALAIGKATGALYLDLESAVDRNKLTDPMLFLGQYLDRLVILDEIHRMPELFQTLRVLIDHARREGKPTGRYLVLGSAAIDLLRQTSESLAGRIEFVQLGPFSLSEVTNLHKDHFNNLWVRGGFPGSFLASNDEDSLAFRKNFIRTYLERDVPQLGFRIPAETLYRFWSMLAHQQGGLLNASRLAAALAVSMPTVSKYVDLLVDLLLIRRLPPYRANLRKRQIKAHKVYVRDTGLLHALLGIESYFDLSGHPVAGNSFEGLVVETLLSILPSEARASFYRSQGGAEVDLLLELPGSQELWAIEVKRSLAPRPDRGFYHATNDLQPAQRFVVYPGRERYKLSETVDVIGVEELMTILQKKLA